MTTPWKVLAVMVLTLPAAAYVAGMVVGSPSYSTGQHSGAARPAGKLAEPQGASDSASSGDRDVEARPSSAVNPAPAVRRRDGHRQDEHHRAPGHHKPDKAWKQAGGESHGHTKEQKVVKTSSGHGLGGHGGRDGGTGH